IITVRLLLLLQLDDSHASVIRGSFYPAVWQKSDHMSTSSLRGSLTSRAESADEDDEVLMRENHVSRERLKELREIFQFIDRDRGGTVSGQELIDLIRVVSSNFSELQLKLLMNKIDVNGDGEMGFDEFVKLLSNEPPSTQQDISATREAFEIFDTVSLTS
ncbi:Calmodulin, partial [Paragonimus heterotremus]